MDDFFFRFNRLAIVGLSRDPKSFSRQAYSFLKAHGYELYPVNPNVDVIDGQPCYQSIDSLPDVEAAVLFTPPRVSETLLPQCQAKGIVHVWFQQGSADKAVFDLADRMGIIYKNSCVFLHHPQAGFPHNLHRFFANIFAKD